MRMFALYDTKAPKNYLAICILVKTHSLLRIIENIDANDADGAHDFDDN